MRLKDKIAAITGAGSGIGEAIARLFAAEGAIVVLADISTSGEKTADGIKKRGGDASFVRTDVTRPDDVVSFLDLVRSKYGRLDILVNCAGIFGKESTLADLAVSEWEQIFKVNVEGMFLTCKYAMPLLEASGTGSIINIASSVALKPIPLHAAYTSSKGAIITLSRALAIEVARSRIRVNYINPGAVDTPMLDDFSAEDKQNIVKSIPLGRIIKPEDVAQAAVFFASDDSSMVTGCGVNVDGGLGV